jgi:ATP-binding cassette subfamily C protein
MPTKALRTSQSLIPQETFLFDTSIEENIRMRDTTGSQSAVEEAAQKASIHDFIVGLPDGYATKIGELGDRLSEGEKQRLSLARAFYKDSDIMLLDEPTSNLDVLNEAVILKSLKEYADQKQVVLVSHRQSTTAICDEMIEL